MGCFAAVPQQPYSYLSEIALAHHFIIDESAFPSESA
jgi:hypothetical protein